MLATEQCEKTINKVRTSDCPERTLGETVRDNQTVTEMNS